MSKIQYRTLIHHEKAEIIYFPEQNKVKFQQSGLLFKRIFDIATSLLVIIFILSWLLPILAILIKLNSRGPAFFIQKRIGLKGKPFNCIKLRTMVVNDQAHSQQAVLNDPRITLLGKFLRKSCFDEFPQFFNVLKGEMSIVGPRPHMINDCSEFSKIIKNYNERHSVKPGITGMAQVRGYRGKTNDFYDVFHRFKWDMYYIRNVNFELDIKILRCTIQNTLKVIFNKKAINFDQGRNIDYKIKANEILN